MKKGCELKGCTKTFLLRASTPHQRFCCATHKNLWHARERQRILVTVRQLGMAK